MRPEGSLESHRSKKQKTPVGADVTGIAGAALPEVNDTRVVISCQ